MSKILYFLNSLAVVCLLFAYLSSFVNPAITWFFSFFGLFYFPILITNIIFIILWLILKPKYALMSLIGIAIGWNALLKNIGFSPDESNEDGLTVMTYNIGKIRYEMTEDNAEKKIKEFETILEQAQPDIVCLQERASRHQNYYDIIFRDYRLYAEDELGTAIYSKLPVVQYGNIPFDTKAHNGTWTDVMYQNQLVRVYAIHLSSNHVTKKTDEVLEQRDIRNKKLWGDIRYILSKYHKHGKIRIEQLKTIIKHSQAIDHPAILAGDFNDIPQSFVYNLVCSNYNDAFRECGKGLQQTYASTIPGLRIDYTFIDEKLQAGSQKLIKSDLSDHYPLVTNIHLIK